MIPVKPWIKLWHEARTDSKLAGLTDPQHRVWFNLLCLAGEQDDDGQITADSDRVLAVMVSRGDIELLHETLDYLADMGIVTADATVQRDCNVAATVQRNATEMQRNARCICFKNWIKRQHRPVASDSMTSTERSRKHRANKRLATKQNLDATVQRDCNAMQRDATPQEGEGEGELKSASQPAGSGDETAKRDPDPVVTSTAPAPIPVIPGPAPVISAPPPSPPGPYQTPPAIVEDARVRFGEPIARLVSQAGPDVARVLNGRWDCYLAGLARAKRHTEPIIDAHAFALTVAKAYTVQGLPPEPLSLTPAVRPRRPAEKLTPIPPLAVREPIDPVRAEGRRQWAERTKAANAIKFQENEARKAAEDAARGVSGNPSNGPRRIGEVVAQLKIAEAC